MATQDRGTAGGRMSLIPFVAALRTGYDDHRASGLDVLTSAARSNATRDNWVVIHGFIYTHDIMVITRSTT